jgi:large conductance mechanosensitive channel
MVRNLATEFQNFAFKGNVIDLAVAVIIGGAFGKVVDSAVKHLIMPLISYLGDPKGAGYEAWMIGRVQIGAFLAEFLNFLIVAFAVFLLIVKTLQMLQKMRRREEGTPAAAAVPEDVKLLTEIRDLLRQRQ